jgi:hypothetical protein
MERLAFGSFVVSLIALFPLVVFVRLKIVDQETVIHACYWTIAFATTFGADPEPMNGAELILSVVWMVLSVTVWAAIVTEISNRVSAFLMNR